MPPQTQGLYRLEEYLAIERVAPERSEYWRGVMYPMRGAQQNHCLITVSTGSKLHAQVRARSTEVYMTQMRVLVSDHGCAYPDIVVVSERPRFFDETADLLLNPTLIVEVLSPSTQAYDRGAKFESYRGIEFLREYLMIWQDRVHAELYTRQPSGQWTLTEASRFEDELHLTSCDCRLKLADLYAKVEFNKPEEPTARPQ